MLKRLMRAGVGLPLVLAVLVVTVPLSGCGLRQPPTSARANVPVAPRVASGSERFAKATDKLEDALQAASRGYAKGSVDATAVAEIRAFSGELDELDRGVRADFAKTRKILKKIDSPKKSAIQKRFERQYEARNEVLRRKLYDVEQARGSQESSAAIAALSLWLDEINPEPAAQPIGTQLPNRIVDYKAGSPAIGIAVAPAYAPNAAGAIPSSLPVTPSAADTSETIEVRFTEEIRSLAASLGNDPVRMYEYVRNSIDYEPYYGSRKGATETLLEGSGNDVDTASLLIALYRVSGIPARYVSGVVDVPIEKAENWVGVDTPEAAARLFTAGGTPTSSLVLGGRADALEIEHVWIEALVPYEDYRGSKEGRGSARWIPLDASYKEYKRPSMAAVLRAGIGVTATAEALSQSVSVDGDRYSLDTTVAGQTLAAFSEEATKYAENGVAKGGSFLPSIVEKPLQVLPSALAFHSVPNAEWTSVPDGLAEKVKIQLGDESVDVRVAALTEGLFNIRFTYADSTDADLAVAAGRLSEIAPYLVRVRPTVVESGEVVAQSSPIALASPISCSVSLQAPGYAPKRISNSLTAAGEYALMIDRGHVPLRRLLEARRGLEADTIAFESGASVQQRIEALSDTSARELETGIKLYFAEAHSARLAVAGAMNVASIGLTSVGMSGLDVSVERVLGLPARVVPSGLFLDVDGLNTAAIDKSGGDGGVSAFALAFGAAASGAEGNAWDSLLPSAKPARSTASIFTDSIRAGIPLLFLTPSNVRAVLGPTPYAAGFKTALVDEVANGSSILIPARPVAEDASSEVAYVIWDPETGSTGFMISQDRAGSKNRFPNQGAWLAVQTFWDTAGILAVIGASAGGMSAGGLAALGLALTIPSFAMTTASFISFLLWLEQQDISDAAKGVMAAEATAIWLLIYAATLTLLFSSMAPAPAAMALLAVSMVGTLFFSVILPGQVLYNERLTDI